MIDSILDGTLSTPKIFTGFVGHISGGEPVQDQDLFSACEPIDFVERFSAADLASVMSPEPARGPAATLEAREAARIMTASILYGAARAIEKETDPRIMLTALDRLVQEMIGWRDHPPVAPGLPTLKIPPRSFPEGWREDRGVISRMPTPWETMPPMPFVCWEYISYYERGRRRAS